MTYALIICYTSGSHSIFFVMCSLENKQGDDKIKHGLLKTNKTLSLLSSTLFLINLNIEVFHL